MKLLKDRQGELIVVLEAILWSFFPIITIYIYKTIDPLFTLILSNFFAAAFFLVIIFAKNKWHEFKNKKALSDILWASATLTILWLFLFTGLQFTTAGNASIFMLMEILFSFLYFGLWHKEKFSKAHITGALIMGFGAIFVLFPGEFVFNKGDILIIIGATLGPIVNYFQQKARKQVSTETMLFVRNIVSMPIIATIAFFSNQTIPSLENLKIALPLLIISGTILFGLSKIMWVEAIHRISVSKAISLNTMCPALTLFFAYFLLNEIPSFWQIFGLIPMLIGAVLMTRK